MRCPSTAFGHVFLLCEGKRPPPTRLHTPLPPFHTRARAGRSDLEAGDKVILPTSSLKEISRLKLPFPLLFKVSNDRLKTANTVPSKDGKMPAPATAEQYAGLMEFSAPDGVAYIPQWMMANLKLREGGKVGFATAPRGLPQASFAKFRPHQQAFVDLAAEIGPRDLLEAAMRNYSVLSEGAFIARALARRARTASRAAHQRASLPPPPSPPSSSPSPAQASASSSTWRT